MGYTGKMTTERYEMEYYRFGSGTDHLVIIPGVSMKPVVPLGPALEGVFSRFAERYTVCLFDRKLNMTEGYSIADMADDTADAMKQLGISDADIYAVSQGGMIAMTLALNHKELVRRLYISSTFARPNARSMAVLDQWMALAGGEDSVALYECVNSYVYSAEYLEKYADAFAAMSHSGTKEEMTRFGILVDACRGFDVYNRLPEITCPVYVTGSRADRIMGAEGPQEVADRLGCPCYLYDGYSHAVYDEAPDYFGRMYDILCG